MDKVLIANIGQRDIALGSAASDVAPSVYAELEQLRALKPPRLREWAQLVNENYELFAPHLETMILTPVMESLSRKGVSLDCICLVATNQKDERFNAGDTCDCALVIKRLLADRGCVSNVCTCMMEYVKQPPHDLNRMLDEYQRIVDGLDAAWVFAECSGGTPACNTALSLRCIERFGENCTEIYAPEKAPIIQLNMGRYILDGHRRHTLERQARAFDFSAIAGSDQPPAVCKIAAAAAARLNLDFPTSRQILQDACAGPCPMDVASTLKSLKEEADDLVQGKYAHVMREVYWNAVVKWRRNEYADFLGRVWRLLEESLRHILKNLWNAAPNPAAGFEASFRRWTQQVGLRERPNIPGMVRAISFLLAHPHLAQSHDANKVRQAMDVASSLDQLRTLRNESIIAHGFTGLSHNHVLQGPYKTEQELLDALERLLKAQDIETRNNPYAVFVHVLLNLEQ